MNATYNKKVIINKLFPCPPHKNYNNLLIDDDSISYITTPINADTITQIINSLIPGSMSRSELTILDATACVGGDSIAFGQLFGTVISSEIDKTRYNMLVNNLKEYDLSNVIPINDDCLKIINRINFIDIMYFDPPWGGKSYKNDNLLRLSIGDLFIDEIVNIIFNINMSDINIRSDVKMVIFKLPKNYDIFNLYQMTKSPDIIMSMYELSKMIIIVFKKSDFI
jgi:predicted RNA methylase